jgi:hypothetical protein
MDNNRASSILPKLWTRKSGRGAFRVRGSWVVRPGGAHGKANVGISNDKMGEKPIRRKTKVS